MHRAFGALAVLALVGVTFAATKTSAPVPRGIPGLQLGMKPDEVSRSFKLKEAEDPVAKLLAKYGKQEPGKAESRTARAIRKQFFRVEAGSAKLPEGVVSTDLHTFQNITYQIGLHYGEDTVKKLGWHGVSAQYLAKFGTPSRDTGNGYVWEDGRTRIELVASGSIINLFFTDLALELEVKRAERDRM